jgi:hypothetical protein
LSVKGTRGATDMHETFAQKLAMRRIVQPPRGTGGMRQGNERDAILQSGTADCVFERDLAPKTIDREAAEKKDDLRLEKS